MFFVGGSWQASFWVGWAYFCYGCAFFFKKKKKTLILCFYIYFSYW